MKYNEKPFSARVHARARAHTHTHTHTHTQHIKNINKMSKQY